VLGALFFALLTDKFGRKMLFMVTLSVYLIATLNAVTQTICWSIFFFFASAGASSAYLTVSEVFPLEIRAQAIALFYAIGIGAAALAPLLFGVLIQSGKPVNVFYGNLLGAVVMAAAGVIEILFGVDAKRQSLEHVARPLSAVEVAAA